MESKLRWFAEFFAKPTPRKKLTTALVVANLLVFSLYASGWVLRSRALAAQDAKRVITRGAVLKDEPVEVEEIRINDRAVRPGETFEGDEEWLKKVDFKLKNRWDKAITYIVLNVDFPETKDTGSMMMHSLYLGQRSDVKSSLTNPPIRLEPNQSVTISLAPQFAEIKKLIESRQPPIGRISKATVWLDQVTFEDDMTYSGGNIFKRNPDQSSPRKWVPANTGRTPPQN